MPGINKKEQTIASLGIFLDYYWIMTGLSLVVNYFPTLVNGYLFQYWIFINKIGKFREIVSIVFG